MKLTTTKFYRIARRREKHERRPSRLYTFNLSIKTQIQFLIKHKTWIKISIKQQTWIQLKLKQQTWISIKLKQGQCMQLTRAASTLSSAHDVHIGVLLRSFYSMRSILAWVCEQTFRCVLPSIHVGVLCEQISPCAVSHFTSACVCEQIFGTVLAPCTSHFLVQQRPVVLPSPRVFANKWVWSRDWNNTTTGYG